MKKEMIRMIFGLCVFALLLALGVSALPAVVPAVTPPTGDTSNIWLWVALLAGSLVAIVLLFIFLRPKKHKGKYTRKR